MIWKLIVLYVDPGSGMLLAQIITAVAGVLIAFRKRVASLFRKKDSERNS